MIPSETVSASFSGLPLRTDPIFYVHFVDRTSGSLIPEAKVFPGREIRKIHTSAPTVEGAVPTNVSCEGVDSVVENAFANARPARITARSR
jgi:hypothetical protein